MRYNKKLIVGLSALIAAFALCSCGSSGTTEEESNESTKEFYAMDTIMSVTCYGEDAEEAASAAVQEVNRLDKLLSISNESGEVYKINQDGESVLSGDTKSLVEKSLELYASTNGSFDITVEPLMELWGFTTSTLHVPTEDELSQTLAICGSEKLTYDEAESKLILGDDQKIDFGGIAKGYASGRLMEIFDEYKIDSAYVSLGGNVQCYGTKTDGSDWRIGIKSPENDGTVIGVVSVVDKAVVTSGDYERYLTDEETGEIYHHILDPKTGKPAQSGLRSVTIVSTDGMLADGLSTACYVMGLDQSIEYWKAHSDEFDFVIITEDDEVYATENLENSLEFKQKINIVQK